MKTLTIGNDYSFVFGRPAGSLVFAGGISWTVNGDKGKGQIESKQATDAALAYINKPATLTGTPR